MGQLVSTLLGVNIKWREHSSRDSSLKCQSSVPQPNGGRGGEGRGNTPRCPVATGLVSWCWLVALTLQSRCPRDKLGWFHCGPTLSIKSGEQIQPLAHPGKLSLPRFANYWSVSRREFVEFATARELGRAQIIRNSLEWASVSIPGRLTSMIETGFLGWENASLRVEAPTVSASTRRLGECTL